MKLAKAMTAESFDKAHAPARLIRPVAIAFVAVVITLASLWALSTYQIDSQASAREAQGAGQLVRLLADRPLEEVVAALNESGLGVASLGASKDPMAISLVATDTNGLKRGEISFVPFRPARRIFETQAWYKAWILGLAGGALVIVIIRLAIKLHNLDARRAEAIRMTMTDALTGLANRRQFAGSLSDAVESLNPKSPAVVLYLIELQGLRDINDVYGLDAGDTVIRAVGGRLKSFAGSHDMVARVSGSEFAIIRREAISSDAALAFGNSLIKLLTTPYDIGECLVRIGASVGASGLSADQSRTEADLCRDTDRALAMSKSTGRNKAVVFGGFVSGVEGVAPKVA